MDYFGKRDLIYIDMRGQESVDDMYTTNYNPPTKQEDAEEDEWGYDSQM